MFRGWRIVGVAALAQAVSVGSTFYVYGAFLKPIAEEFDASRLAVTLGQTFMAIVQGMAAPFIGRAFDGGSARRLMLTGVGLLSVGLILFSRITAFWQAALLFVVPIALGAHLFGPFATSTLIARWFVRRRGQALGFTSLGSAIGGAFFPPVATALIASLGWRGAVAVLGASILLLVVPFARLIVGRPEDVGETPDGDAPPRDAPPAAPVIRPTLLPSRPATARHEPAAESDRGAVPAPAAPLPTTRALLGDRRFWAITIAIGAGYGPVSVLLIHIVPYATDAGLSATRAATLLTGYAVGSAFGRVLIGWLADRFDPRAVLWLDYGWFFLFWLGLLAPPSYGLLMLTAVACGLSVGGVTPLWATFTGVVYGREAFGRAMGLMNLLMLPFSIAGAPIAAHLFDETGSYRLAFASFLLCFVVGAGAIAFLRIPEAAGPRATGA